jgi:hypothetical protein
VCASPVNTSMGADTGYINTRTHARRRTHTQLTIKANLCRWLNADVDCVNIKAKTHEKVDAVGEQRAIACHCVVMLIHDPSAITQKNTFASVRSGDLDFYS